MVIVGAAVEREMSVPSGLSSAGVVGKLVRAQSVSPVMNLHVPLQLVDGAVFLLAYRANDRLIGFFRFGLPGAWCARIGRGGLSFARRRLPNTRAQLAGNYRSVENQVTKQRRRDKESVAR